MFGKQSGNGKKKVERKNERGIGSFSILYFAGYSVTEKGNGGNDDGELIHFMFGAKMGNLLCFSFGIVSCPNRNGWCHFSICPFHVHWSQQKDYCFLGHSRIDCFFREK